MKRILIKIGSKILTTKENKLDLNNLRRLVDQISYLVKTDNIECIIVSSGSITSGSEMLNTAPKTIPEKQAAASVGQLLLMNEYYQFFSKNSLKIGQILLTKDVMTDMSKQNHVKNTILTLLKKGIVPIINENDSVATDEIQFGDNDILASIIAPIISVDLVVFLTDADGLFDKDPLTDKDAKLFSSVTHITDQTILEAPDSQNSSSKGGIKSKLIAVKSCIEQGIESGIANGRHELTLKEIIFNRKSGTWFKL